MHPSRNPATAHHRPQRESLRLVVAFFIMAQAVGFLPDPAGRALFQAFLPAPYAGQVYAISIFTAAWLILVGQHFQRAALFMITITLLAMLSGQIAYGMLLRDAVVLTALFLIGGFFNRKRAPRPDPGRVRLTRISSIRTAKPRAASGTARKSAPNRSATAQRRFSQTPDDLDCLFDQIVESRQSA